MCSAPVYPWPQYQCYTPSTNNDYLNNNYDYVHPTTAKVELANMDLWKKFYALQTEMILTKGGRRMFPSLELNFRNLEPDASYCIMLEISPVNSCRYKFSSGAGWTAAGTDEFRNCRTMYMHPQSPAKGRHWMSQKVLLDKVKLTNTQAAPNTDHIVLSSMHKYMPRIHIFKTDDVRNIKWAPTSVVTFPETEFVAVTAYQNEKITQLKIDHNPFAKGFRETGQAKCKRKRQVHHDAETSENESSDSERAEKVAKPCDSCTVGGSQKTAPSAKAVSIPSSSPSSSDCSETSIPTTAVAAVAPAYPNMVSQPYYTSPYPAAGVPGGFIPQPYYNCCGLCDATIYPSYYCRPVFVPSHMPYLGYMPHSHPQAYRPYIHDRNQPADQRLSLVTTSPNPAAEPARENDEDVDVEAVSPILTARKNDFSIAAIMGMPQE